MQNNLTNNDHGADFFTQRERSVRIALVVVGALIVYGSLFPFEFRTPADLADRFVALLRNWNPLGSLSDVLGNILLFLPYGALSGWLILSQARASIGRAASYLLFGMLLATLCQFAQVWLPARTASMGDVLTNMVGLVGGLTIAPLWRRARSRIGLSPALAGPACLTLAWIVAELAPLVPTLSPSLLRENLAPLLSQRLDIANASLAAVALPLLAHLLGGNLPARVTRWAIPGLAGSVAAGKILVVGAGLGIGDCAGLLLGMWISLALRHTRRANAVTVIALGLMAVITLRGLLPFEFRSSPGQWNWMPFASWLQGSLLSNARTLAASVFLYGGLLCLLEPARRRAKAPPIALALWVTLLEIAQVWIDGRSGDITEPLLVFVARAMLLLLPTESVRQPTQGARPEPERPNTMPRSDRGPWLGILAICAGTAIATGLVLRLPGVPYNVKELFLLDGSFVARALFGLPLIWIGVAPVLAARLLATSRLPARTWGWVVAISGLVSLLLLSICVTGESIGDIAGGDNLHWYVTHRDIWGAWWREVFLFIGQPIVSFVELPVRFMALYGPLPVFLAIIWLGTTWLIEGNASPQRYALVVASALPWLWLCKAIAFDWSSTDNLNELVAPDGEWGWGGGGYLYALLGLICSTAVLGGHAAIRRRCIAGAIVSTLISVPIGWWLLNAGLNPAVEKYGNVFSGAQFLLGPDRSHLLTPQILFVRWGALQVAVTIVIGMGLFQGASLIGWLSRRALRLRTPPRRT